MNNIWRIAIVLFSALVIGAYTYASASDLDRTGGLGSIVFSAAANWACLVLLVLAVAIVNRWWALSVALVPFGVLFFLREATDYVYPFHEDPYPALALPGTVVLLAICSLGLLLHAALDRITSGPSAWNCRGRPS